MELPWYKNRKFTYSIGTAVASLVVIILSEAIPDFNIPAELIGAWLTFVFVVAGFIIAGDIGFDWFGRLAEALRPTIDFARTRDWLPDTTLDEEALALLKRAIDEVLEERGIE